MDLPADVARVVALHLGHPVREAVPVGGGCIAHATRVSTADGIYFLKYGRGAVAESFPLEAAGLRALRAAGSPLVIPEVIAVGGEGEDYSGFLLMEWLQPGRTGSGFWEAFGRGLAVLHQCTGPRYGFEHDNVIGSTPQRNPWEAHWPTFFREHRLMPQVALARERRRWERRWDAWLEALYKRLDDVLPASPPASLLHGDLWSGNYLAMADGRAALIDPAVYYGHREADLAMTELFGGFSPAFYDAYREAWPLAPGYEERRDVYNLYHLINHLNLFGSSYAGAVARILKQGS